MEELLSLVNLKTGAKGKIAHLLSDGKSRKKLYDLGLREGSEIEKVSNMILDGPITIKILQTRIAIGRQLADTIIVKKT